MERRLRGRGQAGRTADVILVTLLAAALVPTASAWAQTEDAPEPAIMAPLAPRSLILDVAAADGKLVAVGERGHILVSGDGGATWRQSEVPTRALLTGVYFHDARLGWAVGHDSAILKTTDGGFSWKLVHWAPEDEAPLFDIRFWDADHGVAIGAYGTYLITTDGGETWDFSPISDDDWHLHHIARADNGRLYIAAEAGSIYRSDDNGDTWIGLPSPYEGSFFGVLPLGGDTVLLFGLRGNLFRTDDAGETWTNIETGTVAMLTTGSRLSDGTILIAGLGGAVLDSADGGRSFQLHQQEDRIGISAMVETAEGTLLVAGDSGVRVLAVGDLLQTPR